MALDWLGFGAKLDIGLLLFVYVGEEDPVFGKVKLDLKGKQFAHQGVKLELVGQIELFFDRGNHFEFLSREKELLPAGVLDKSQEFDFDFPSAPKPHESFSGVNVRVRYFLRVTVARQMASNLTKELDLWVYVYQAPPDVNNTIKMEVGIEDCLHIEFEYGKSKYHLKDVVIGKIYFLLVRIKIKHMEIALLKREQTGTGDNTYNESETLTKFEIMDGAPVRGESIPVRLFLGGFDLTPSYRTVENKFSLKYYLNLVLVDEEDRRYFKQQEITLWRKVPSGVQLPAQPTQSYSGEREVAAQEEADRKEAEVRKANKSKKKGKKSKSKDAAETATGEEGAADTSEATPSADDGAAAVEKAEKAAEKAEKKKKREAAAAAEPETDGKPTDE